MSDTYTAVAEFVQVWGLLYFVLIFAGVLVYALAPSRKAKFEQASRMPFRED